MQRVVQNQRLLAKLNYCRSLPFHLLSLLQLYMKTKMPWRYVVCLFHYLVQCPAQKEQLGQHLQGADSYISRNSFKERRHKSTEIIQPPKPSSQKIFYCYLKGVTIKYKENWTSCMKGVSILLTHSLRKRRLDPVNQVRRKCTCLLWESKQGKEQHRTCLLQGHNGDVAFINVQNTAFSPNCTMALLLHMW